MIARKRRSGSKRQRRKNKVSSSKKRISSVVSMRRLSWPESPAMYDDGSPQWDGRSRFILIAPPCRSGAFFPQIIQQIRSESHGIALVAAGHPYFTSSANLTLAPRSWSEGWHFMWTKQSSTALHECSSKSMASTKCWGYFVELRGSQ